MWGPLELTLVFLLHTVPDRVDRQCHRLDDVQRLPDGLSPGGSYNLRDIGHRGQVIPIDQGIELLP